MSWEVLFYKNTRGDNPVEIFIKNQQPQTGVKIASAIDALEENGPFISPQFSKKLDSNIYELRITGKIQVRILYTIIGGVFVLLHAFKKKTNKVPFREIKTAIARRNEIL